MATDKNYTIHVDIETPDKTLHCRAFRTAFDIRIPEEKRKLLIAILNQLGDDLADELSEVHYRPAPEEEIINAIRRVRHG